MIINHNIPAMNTNRQLGINVDATSKSLEKLSSGYRINRAGDDAAGLAISEKMRAQIRGLDMAAKNAQDGISLIQTAEGSLDSIENILQRMRELAVQAANDPQTTSDREQIMHEVEALKKEITRIATDTEFNTQKLLDGKYTAKWLQIGANEGQGITISIDTMEAGNGGLDVTQVKLTNATNAGSAITIIQAAIDSVSSARAKLGAIQNRLEYSIDNLKIASENTSAAESRIRDVNMAKEMMAYTKNNILTQAATAMLAQANQLPQTVLTLLR